MPRSVASPSASDEARLLTKLEYLRELQTEAARRDAEAAAKVQQEAARVVADQLAEYRLDPAGFATDLIRWPVGAGLTGYQTEALTTLVQKGRLALRGPHGLGKTAMPAIAVLWFALTRDGVSDWKVPTTASAWYQLTHYLWPEVHKWARLLDWSALGRAPFDERSELLDLSLKLSTGEAFAIASSDSARIEGAHADSLLYVLDEAKAIPVETFDAVEGAFMGKGEALALMVSTPGEPQGRFYEVHSRKAGTEDWAVRHVTLDEAVAAGRVDAERAEQRARQWGRESAVYANRVLGEFASSEEDGVIPLSWVEAANERWRAWDETGRALSSSLSALGVDVADSGPDATVMALRYGDVVTELRRTRKEDPTQTSGRASGILDAHGKGATAVVDVIGVGAGVVSNLRHDGYRVAAFNASEGTDRRDRSGELGFINCRSAAWWHLREELDPAFGASLALPPIDELIGDLTAPHWRVVGKGLIQVESKDEIRKRLGRSTDDGDAVVQSVWPVGGHAAVAAPAARPLPRVGPRRAAGGVARVSVARRR